MKKSELKQIIREEIKNAINEAGPGEYRMWQVIWTEGGVISGVKIKRGQKEVVKARSTYEAIKKAGKKAGLKGDGWMYMDVKVLFAN